MSLRYFAGYSLLFLACLLRKVLDRMWRVVSFPEQFALIIWTPNEIERYARADWNSWPSVRDYARMDHWLHATEQALVRRAQEANLPVRFAGGDARIPAGPSEWLFRQLRRLPPFNREYEPGDRFAGTTFTHFFRSEELAHEFQEAQFLIKD